MKRYSAAFLIFFILFIPQFVSADVTKNEELLELINDFFNCLEYSDFSTASDLFHYPQNYSPEEVQKDKVAVAKILELLSNSFGKINSHVVNMEAEKIISLQVGSGDIPYWQKHPKYLLKIYKVNFSKYGDGFITITICNLLNKYEIREVKYGLGESKPNAIQMLQEAAKSLTEP